MEPRAPPPTIKVVMLTRNKLYLRSELESLVIPASRQPLVVHHDRISSIIADKRSLLPSHLYNGYLRKFW
jgi:hypothetical protein